MHTYYAIMRWNVVETIVYRLLYSIYIYRLYSLTTPSTFSTTVTMFSVLFLCITLFESGLSQNWGPFFSYVQKSKKLILYLTYKNIKIHSVLCLATLLLLYPFLAKISAWYAQYIPSEMHYAICLLYIGIEIIKKSAKKCVYIALSAKMVALTEITSMVVFLICIELQARYYPLMPASLLVWYTLCSTSACVTYLIMLYSWYTKIHEENTPPQIININHVTINRLYSHFYSLLHIPFSSNILLPFIATFYGSSIIPSLKIVSTISHTITLLAEHAVGISGEVALAKTKRDRHNASFIIATIQNHTTLALCISLAAASMYCYFYGISLSNYHHNKQEILIHIFFFTLIILEPFYLNLKNILTISEEHWNLAKINMYLFLIWIAASYFIWLENVVHVMATLAAGKSLLLFLHGTPKAKTQSHV